MRRQTMFIGFGALFLVLVAGYIASTRTHWSEADLSAKAIRLVGEEIGSARGELVARALPAQENVPDRFICVFSKTPVQTETSTAQVFEVQFRRGAFGVSTNEIFTPKWQPPRSGGIVRDECGPVPQ